MRIFALSLLSIILTACITKAPTPQIPPAPSDEQSSITPGYKTAFMSGEVPETWSTAYLGDVGPVPLPPQGQGWIDAKYTMFSFSSRGIAFGDINWEQVDIYQMAPADIEAFIAGIKANPDEEQFTKEWKTAFIGGEEAQIRLFATEPDGTVTKGGTGGAHYFFPKAGWIFWKQALGSPEFEQGVEHFLKTVRFESPLL